MEMMVERHELTPSGRDFLIAALDPMHDNQLKELSGWPDVETASSVVRCIKQTQSISVPPGTGNWDFSLNLFPFLDNLPATVRARTNDTIGAPSATNVPYGGLAGYVLPTGGILDIASSPKFQLTLNDTYSQGASRVVGLGFEIVNTTSTLYRQGQVTVWRQPNASHLSECVLRDTNYGTSSPGPYMFAAAIIESFPTTVPQAMLIPGSRQWEAEDGAYIVAPFVGQDNPPLLVSYKEPCVLRSPSAVDQTFSTPLSNAAPVQANSGEVLVPNPFVFIPPGTTITAQAAPPTKIYPLHQCGAFFQGLSEQTSLAITLNVFVETFPTVAEPDILVLATPSAEYDPVALQLFSHALTQLPVGVPAGWNPFGEWFSDVIETIADWGAAPAAFINPALGAGFTAAGKMAKEYRRRNGYDTAESRESKQKNRAASNNRPKQRSKQLAAPSPNSKPKAYGPQNKPNNPRRRK